MPNQRAEHHLVTVWNPSYAVDAMEQHLSLLLRLAGEFEKRAIGKDALYVWWGKVRSPNRQGPQANADDIRRIGRELAAEERDEVQLYLTDYQSLYVGDVDLIQEQGPGDAESPHIPPYYRQERLSFDFWFRLRDMGRSESIASGPRSGGIGYSASGLSGRSSSSRRYIERVADDGLSPNEESRPDHVGARAESSGNHLRQLTPSRGRR
jgi:hypothetical protein